MKPVDRVGDRFTLEREIGSGGMSVVYLGRDEVLGRRVAVKILRASVEGSEHPSDIDLGSRFEREGRTAARLSHANIVQVYDAGKDTVEADDSGARSVSYIVMEYVSGGDLKELIDRDGPLSGRKLTRLGSAVASGLAHAHERGVIHRDIKPQNVLMDEYGNPKLTDFGIARALEADGSSNMTKTGHYLGTATYSAPEQLSGEGTTPKSDVYALGMTLYHAATGETPFSGTPIEIATQKMHRDPEPPSGMRKEVSEEVEGIILACLSRNPDDRPTAQEMQRRLYRAGLSAGGSDSALPLAGAATKGSGSGNVRRIDGRPSETVSLPTRTFQGSRDRGPLIVGAVAVVFLIAVLLGAFALLGGGGTESASDSGGDGGSQGAEATPNSGGNQNSGSGDGSGESANGSGEGGAQPEETTTAEAEETTQAEEDTGPLPPTEAAGQVVFDYYVALAEGRYDDAWASLSSGYQGELGGSVSDLESEESSLNGVFFNGGVPGASLSGREAAVEFEITETRDGASQDVSGTWIAVSEDGEWRLDRLEE